MRAPVGAGISRSSSAELSDLPCASSASERVTPPPSAPLQHEVEARRAAAARSATTSPCTSSAKCALHALGRDVAPQVLVVARRRRRSPRCSRCRPCRRCASGRGRAASCQTSHDAGRRARRSSRGSSTDCTATTSRAVLRRRRRRRPGRWCRASRPRCRCARASARRVGAAGDAQPHFVRLGALAPTAPRRAARRRRSGRSAISLARDAGQRAGARARSRARAARAPRRPGPAYEIWPSPM